MSLANIAVGFRFNPTEAELACHYLYNKVMGLPLSCPYIVQDYDLYGHEEPWQIWENFGEHNNTTSDDEDDDEVEAGPSPQDDLFFFTNLRKINRGMKSSKFDRGVGSNGGRWHGDDVHSFHSKGITWNRRRYCYKNPNIGTPDASWIMLEYSLDDSLMQNVPHYTVLCRIRKKSNKNCSRKRKSSQSSSQLEPKRQSKKLNSKLRTPPIKEKKLFMWQHTHLTFTFLCLGVNISDQGYKLIWFSVLVKNVMHSILSGFLDDGVLLHHLPCWKKPVLMVMNDDFNFKDCGPILCFLQLRYS